MLSVVARNNLKTVFSNIIWMCIAGYFVYHIIIGERGLPSYISKKGLVERLESELRQLKTDNEFLNNKVKGLRSDTLDLDLLEEEAEKILGFSHPDDLVVLLPRD